MTSFNQFKNQARVLRDGLAMSPLLLTFLTTVFIIGSYNATFWAIGADVFRGHPMSFAGYMAAVFFLALAAFSMFAFPYIAKPCLAFFVILSAVTSYYMDTLGVVVDRDMIQNIMATTFSESKHLITFGFVSHVLIKGVLPAAIILSIRIIRQGPVRTRVWPIAAVFISLSLTFGFLMADLKSYASILRERKDFMSSLQPLAPIVGAIRYGRMMSRAVNVVVQPIGEDAKKGQSYTAHSKPVLTIVVAGETARSQNFGLNGYDQNTTPELAKRPIVNFTNVGSCGTATAVSLPCMFSQFPRVAYSYEKGIAHQNVLDVLTHAGLKVAWWDNNTGDKGLARRIDRRDFTKVEDDEFCGAGECTDGIFLRALAEYATTVTEDTVLVLHQIGSHGPTYYLRYPPEFERFTPACRTAEFKDCTTQEITNAYDNTIAYTDAMLAQTIDILSDNQRLSTALLYVSDHGESLGEAGLYLHGSPRFLAPEYQTRVPMILWMSKAFKDQFDLDQECLVAKKDMALSHDNLFHSLLGMLDIITDVHDPALDIFASCKSIQKVGQN